MNGRTATLLNRYAKHVTSQSLRGKEVPDRQAAYLQERVKRHVYKTWNTTPRPHRRRMRARILAEMGNA